MKVHSISAVICRLSSITILSSSIVFGMNPAYAQKQCRAQVGQIVTLTKPADVADTVAGGAVTKGEFETTAEFAARKQKMAKGVGGSSIFVEVISDPSYIQYDADRERFQISQYAWANVRGDFEAVPKLWPLSPSGSINIMDKVHGLGVSSTEKPTGSYQASNAYGKVVEVVQIERTLYSLFDKVAQPDQPTWRFDYTIKGNYSSEGGLLVPAKRDSAPRLKQSMRFGIEFSPRDPFMVNGSQNFGPNIDRPTDITENITVLIGDMRCLYVTDETGKVLKASSMPY